MQQRLASSHGDASASDWRERPIVLCDSNVFTRRMTRDILRNSGVRRLTTCEQPSGALWFLKRAVDPILIADGNNAEALQLIRQMRRTRGVERDAPAILIARDLKTPDVMRARDIGASAIAARPLAPQTLFERLDEVCAHPRTFIDTPRFSGPDRRIRPPADAPYKRQADVDAGRISALGAAINEARSVIFERLRMKDPLSARVGRSLELFLTGKTDMSGHDHQVVALHRATLGKLVDEAHSEDDTRLEIVQGLERLVSRRAA